MENKPKFSVIIPVYNTEEYIIQCLDSIEKQSYSDFEVICVNDGSMDKSLELLEKYSKDYENITIVNQENQGAGAAKNAGIAKARGEYITFVDADDWLKKNLLEECFYKLNVLPDVVVFGANTFHQNNAKTSLGQYSSRYFPRTFSYSKVFKFNTIACAKVYRREFIVHNNIEFSRTKTGEDQIFFLKSMLLAKDIEILKKDLYIYRKGRSSSLTASKIKKDFSPLDNFYTIVDFVMQENLSQKIRNKILSRYLLKAITWYAKTDKSLQDAYLSRLLEIFEYLKNNIGYGWWSHYSIVGKSTKLQLKLEYVKSVLIFNYKSLGRKNG